MEEVTLTCGKIKCTYSEYVPVTGRPEGDVEAYWDIVMNNKE